MNKLLERTGAGITETDAEILQAYETQFKAGSGAVALVVGRYGSFPTPQEDLPACFGIFDAPPEKTVLGWASFVNTPTNPAA